LKKIFLRKNNNKMALIKIEIVKNGVIVKLLSCPKKLILSAPIDEIQITNKKLKIFFIKRILNCLEDYRNSIKLTSQDSI